MQVVGVRGVRVLTPTSKLWAVPGLGPLFERAERAVCDLPGPRAERRQHTGCLARPMPIAAP